MAITALATSCSLTIRLVRHTIRRPVLPPRHCSRSALPRDGSSAPCAGRGPARGQRVDVDTQWSDLGSQRPRQGDDRHLRRGVCRAAGQWSVAADGGDVDDDSSTLMPVSGAAGAGTPASSIVLPSPLPPPETRAVRLTISSIIVPPSRDRSMEARPRHPMPHARRRTSRGPRRASPAPPAHTAHRATRSSQCRALPDRAPS